MATGSLKIKVCGMRHPDNLEEVCALGPDYVGYIFYPGSKRYVGKDPDPALFKIPTDEIKKTGVFVNEKVQHVISISEALGLDLVQLHGSESLDYCRIIRDAGFPVIKAFDPGLVPQENPAPSKKYSLEDYSELIHLFLFDTPGPGYGGTGQKFDWNLVLGAPISSPFLLSGGIGPDDAMAIGKLKHSSLHGIDVNSKFEVSPGFKDIPLLRKFILEIRK